MRKSIVKVGYAIPTYAAETGYTYATPKFFESEKAGGVKEIIGGLYEFLKDFDCLDLSPAETFLKG